MRMRSIWSIFPPFSRIPGLYLLYVANPTYVANTSPYRRGLLSVRSPTDGDSYLYVVLPTATLANS